MNKSKDQTSFLLTFDICNERRKGYTKFPYLCLLYFFSIYSLVSE